MFGSLSGRQTVKSIACGAFYYSGAYRLFGRHHYVRGRRISIVTLHRVADRAPDDPHSLPTLFLSTGHFRELIRFLAAHYEIITLDDLLAMLMGEREAGANSLLITFDDGYLDVFENALPILKREGLPATVFLPTEFIDSPDRVFWWDECYFLLESARKQKMLTRVSVADEALRERLTAIAGVDSPSAARMGIVLVIHLLQTYPRAERERFLQSLWTELDVGRDALREQNLTADWAQIGAAVNDGFTFGSHTCKHLFLDCESAETVQHELRQSKQEIERRLGTAVRTFAYPGGKISADVERWVAQAGYECAVTTLKGINRVGDPPLTLKRLNIWNGTVSAPDGSFSPARLAFSLRVLRRFRAGTSA